MKLDDLKPNDVQRKIKKYEGRVELNRHVIKLWRERKDADWLKEKIDEQLAIITEAKKKIDALNADADAADQEIAKAERSIRFDKKQLAELRNRKKILRLLKLVAEATKETANEKDNNDQKES
jgi:hypothetical protein